MEFRYAKLAMVGFMKGVSAGNKLVLDETLNPKSLNPKPLNP